MNVKEWVRRLKEYQELLSKVVKQQEDIKKKRRQKLMGEEVFERKQEKIFKPLWKNTSQQMSAVPTIECTPIKTSNDKRFSSNDG